MPTPNPKTAILLIDHPNRKGIDAAITQHKLRSRMPLQVNDELLFDALPAEAEELRAFVQHEMEHVAEFSVPIVAEVGLGSNWRDIK
jgi:DNA polymerase-1